MAMHVMGKYLSLFAESDREYWKQATKISSVFHVWPNWKFQWRGMRAEADISDGLPKAPPDDRL